MEKGKKSSLAKLKINNIGNIREADITIDENFVIAGHNNIGKSTITKIIFSIVKGIAKANEMYNELELMKEDKSRDIEIEKNKYIRKHNLQLTTLEKDFEYKVKELLYTRWICRYIKALIGVNVRRFGESRGSIEFCCEDFKLEYETGDFIGTGLKIEGDYKWFKDITLISSTEILNYSNLIVTADIAVSEEFNKSKLVSPQDKDLIDKLNKEFVDMLDENFDIKEGLGFDKLGYAFYKENGNSIKINMLGTGKKLFIILDKLIKNKSINKDTLVLFDEPEEGMHPEWQLEFIEKLSNEKINFAITTHSPFIIQSLIYHNKNNESKINYYTVSQNKQEGYANCTKIEKPLNIVKDLTNPMLKVRGF